VKQVIESLVVLQGLPPSLPAEPDPASD